MSIIYKLSEHKEIREKYKQWNSHVPMHEKVDPIEKIKPLYCKNVAENAFYALLQNKHYFPIGHYGYMQLLRDYLTGNQDEKYYLNILRTTEPSGVTTTDNSTYEYKYKGYDHLDTKIVSSMPNIRSAIQGMMADYDEFIFVNTIDEQSGNEEIEKLNEAYIDSKIQDYAKSLQQQYNIPLERPTNFPKSVTWEELNIYREMGGFKAKWAEGIEQIGFYTQKRSNWNKTIKRKFIDDILCFNFIVGRTIFDTENNESRIEYMNPENTTIQYSTENDFNDAEYAGYFTLEKISKLIQKGFSSDELKKSAITYQGYFSNPKLDRSYTINPARINGDKIMDFRIPVFHYYWIDTDVKRILKIDNKFGDINHDLNYEEDVKPTSDYNKKRGVSQKINEFRIRRAYQCSLIVNTDLVYDYGLVPNQYRENKKEPKLPISAYRIIATNENEIFGSMVEKNIPFLNRQQILWLKYQDALSKSHPGGYLINMRLLQNMEIGGKNISPLEAFDMFWRYGRGVYMDTPIGEGYTGGAVLPFTQIGGNYGELLSVLANEMKFIKNEIRENTGIDPSSLGILSEGSSATDISLANRGTGNILKPLQEAIFDVKSGLINIAVNMVQIISKNNKDVYENYIKIVGEDVMDVLVNLDKLGREYGITLEPKPSQEEIQNIIQAANAALSTGRDGASQIDLGQWMYLQERIMNGGNIKKLRRDIAFMIRKKEERDQAMILERERVNGETQAKVAELSNQAKQKEIYMKSEAEIAINDKEKENQAYLNKQEQELSIERYAWEKHIDELALSGQSTIKENE
jgi:hypothetical protein